MSIHSSVYDPLTNSSTISSIVSNMLFKTVSVASEFLENLESKFPQYYIYNDVTGSKLQPHGKVLSVFKHSFIFFVFLKITRLEERNKFSPFHPPSRRRRDLFTTTEYIYPNNCLIEIVHKRFRFTSYERILEAMFLV